MTQKKILVLLPYSNIFPPMNGGMLRCFHILHQLSKFYEVTTIMHQPSQEFLISVNEFPEIKKIKIVSTGDHPLRKDFFSLFPRKISPALRYRWIRKSWKGPADSDFLKYYPLLKKLLKKEQYDIIILENLATLKTSSLIRKYQQKAVLVYDVHNVDSNLAKEEFVKGFISRSVLNTIIKAESSLYKKVDKLLICSTNDLNAFISLNEGKLVAAVIPNGVTLSTHLQNEAVNSDNADHIIFCGSLGYPPNGEGLFWFYKSIWPLVLKQFPGIKLLVIGSGKLAPQFNAIQKDDSVIFRGKVPDVREYYNKACVAIVPLKSGSGTRLKILEAMSLGVPVISTTKGAEGIKYSAGNNIFISDDEQSFSTQLIKLIRSKDIRLFISSNARTLVSKEYNWDVIGNTMRNFLDND